MNPSTDELLAAASRTVPTLAAGHVSRPRLLRSLTGASAPLVLEVQVAAAAHLALGREQAAERALATTRTGDPPVCVKVAALLVEAVRTSGAGSPGAARVLVAQSLRLAATEGHRRPFREADPAARRLLAGDAQLLSSNRWLMPPTYAPARSHERERHREGAAAREGLDSPVVDSLTAKELEVLRHSSQLLTTEEMADGMFVSVNTVRTHVRSIVSGAGEAQPLDRSVRRAAPPRRTR